MAIGEAGLPAYSPWDDVELLRSKGDLMTLLLLAGTAEAVEIAQLLADRGVATIASLAGGSRVSRKMPVPVRVGGFGGEEGFRAFLSDHSISAVLDATHPFAERITERTARVCAEEGLPYCLVSRPAWTATPDDNWIFIDREEDAANYIPDGSVVFLATGRRSLDGFANLEGSELICRQIEAVDTPFPFQNGRFLVGSPPFSVEEERDVFTKLKVDWLIVKNAGGDASFSKMIAARQMKLPVIVIRRPSAPEVPVVETAAEALAWVESL